MNHPTTKEEFIAAWRQINKELIEEDNQVILSIPSVEKTQEWMDDHSNQLR